MGKWINTRGWLNGYRPKNNFEQLEKETISPELDSYGVIFHPIRCPKKECRSKNTKCYKSKPPRRYHVCNDCGCRFKSWEADE